jgi:hypothetical protein
MKKNLKIPIFRVRGSADLIDNRWEDEAMGVKSDK